MAARRAGCAYAGEVGLRLPEVRLVRVQRHREGRSHDAAGWRKKPYALMRETLEKLDRDIIFSLCQYKLGQRVGVGPRSWREPVAHHRGYPRQLAEHVEYRLPAGGLRETGRARPLERHRHARRRQGRLERELRDSGISPNEQVTHIARQAAGGAAVDRRRLVEDDDWTIDLLGNPEMLAVNQDVLGKAASRRRSDGRIEVWARPLADGTIAVGLFNRGPEAATVTATWAVWGLTGRTAGARPVAAEGPRPDGREQISATVPRHGVLVRQGGPHPLDVSTCDVRMCDVRRATCHVRTCDVRRATCDVRTCGRGGPR